MATPSPYNRSYSELGPTGENYRNLSTGGSLANRAARPVGGGNSSMAQRRLETAARRGNLRAAQTLFNAEQWGRNMGGRPMMPQGQRMPMMAPPQRPMMPPLPAGRQGDRMTRGQGDRMPAPMPTGGGLLRSREANPELQTAPPMQAPVDLSNMLPPMPMATRPDVPQVPAGFENMMPPLSSFDPMAPLPPSTFMGGTGVPPPPQFQVQQVGGWDAFVQNMPDGSQKFLNARTTPEAPVPKPPPLSAAEFGQARAAGFEPVQVGGSYFDAQGVPYLQPLPQPTEKVTVNDDGTVTRSYTQPRGQTPAPAAGGAATGASTGGAYTTPGGVKVNLVPDQASAPTMQTGQMPNVAYANDMTPEQSLAAAQQEYAATGNDAALRRHFQQFPSASTRLANEEAKIWQQLLGDVDAYGKAVDDRHAALQHRDKWIDRDTAGNPIIQGVSAQRYASTFPEKMKTIDQQMPTVDFSLIQQANNLNKIAQTRRAMNLR